MNSCKFLFSIEDSDFKAGLNSRNTMEDGGNVPKRSIERLDVETEEERQNRIRESYLVRTHVKSQNVQGLFSRT